MQKSYWTKIIKDSSWDKAWVTELTYTYMMKICVRCNVI